jgi:hypothetical protein
MFTAAFTPVALMINIEGSIVEIPWDKELRRWHNRRAEEKIWHTAELLSSFVSIQVSEGLRAREQE